MNASSPTVSKSGYTVGFVIISLSGNEGEGIASLSESCDSTVFPPCSISSVITTVKGVIAGCFSFACSWGTSFCLGEIMCFDLNRSSFHPTGLISPSPLSIIWMS
jgi:hypothetical protein